VPRHASLVRSTAIGPRAQLLEMRVEAQAEPFAPRPGQYVILDSGVVVGDKKIKRAYSILQWDGVTFRLAVRHNPGGAGSPALCAAPVGQRFGFSGPWGQFGKSESESILLAATDNGITAILACAAPRAALWQRQENDFLPDGFVRELVPGIEIVDDGFAERVERSPAAEIHLAGDGRIVVPLAGELGARVTCHECFFNNPHRKAA
jgi:hypothetical protein